ncbi:MAG: sigma-70 family RNA polymerase sigma factor [Spirochaetes bacterium]|nr:sigma-70 family RNA polymerase sigma factor [Spirochaetota bacterium]MCK5267797.1 sigma-70 family RNA polymerase sigma factor [Spirochaetota bacterium]
MCISKKKDKIIIHLKEFGQEEKQFIEAAYIYKARLIKIASMKLGNADDAEDAVDEAILKASVKHDQLKDYDKMASWIIRVVINHCNDILRKKKNDTQIENVESVLSDIHVYSNPVNRTELIEQIERVLDLMLFIEPEEYSEVLTLYYYQKQTYEDMSNILSVPIGTVKSRLNRARDTLLQQMNQEGITLDDLEQIKDLSRWPDIRCH